MTPNRENIDRLITLFESDMGVHLKMLRYAEFIDGRDKHDFVPQHEPCKTAYCVCGWANHLRLKDEGLLEDKKRWEVYDATVISPYMVELGRQDVAARWLGINEDAAHDLFYLGWSYHPGGLTPFSSYMALTFRESFDALTPLERGQCAVSALVILRETGEARWDLAIPNVIGQERFDEMLKETRLNFFKEG